MFKSFRHEGLRQFFEMGSRSGIRPDYAAQLRKQLAVLDNAVSIADVRPVWRLHAMKGRVSAGGAVDTWSIWVIGTCRLKIVFDGADVVELDYLDNH
jgi:proteic killer suppression protein